MTPEERKKDRGVYKPIVRDDTPLPMLMPCLQHGKWISFWEDELRLDLAQEKELARLEGRDPDEAVKQYRSRELYWRAITCPLMGCPADE